VQQENVQISTLMSNCTKVLTIFIYYWNYTGPT
jgi:hypothetical protein